MKHVLPIIICILSVLSFVGCSNATDGYSSEAIEVILEEETVYQDNTVTSSADSSSHENSSVLQSSSPSDDDSAVVTPSQTDEVKENRYYLNSDETLNYIKLNGRCVKTYDGIGLNFAASALEFNTDSANILLEITADAGVYYSVFIDGELKSERNITESGTNYIALARGLSGGAHNIKIVRETEARSKNTFVAKNILLDEGKSLLAKDSKKTLIEFLGDSLTNGYGNLTTAGANAGQPKYQNSLKAYPYLISNDLGFDYRIVAMSGIAVKERKTSAGSFPAFYDFYSLENYFENQTKQYSSSNPTDVDIVVINLGTNDASSKMYDSNNPSSVEEYSTLYSELITKIGYRTDAKIVFVSGVGWCNAQTKAYSGARDKLNQSGYNNVYLCSCKSYQSGGEGHPSVQEHKQIADEIIKFLKDNQIV